MRPESSLTQFLWLLRTYLAPLWRSILLLIATSYAGSALAAALPVLIAPIIDLALHSGPQLQPASERGFALSELTLRNLGGAVLHWTGMSTGPDRFRAVVVLCALYAAIGVIKGCADFGNYLLALWIRARAAAALQADLFGHLLTLSMRFFTRERTGELVARLNTDTHAATAGLEIVVGTLLTAPLLLAFYGYLMVRTSPVLVLAALVAGLFHYGATRAIRGPIRRLAADQFSVLAELGARFHEAILSIRVVKSFGAEVYEQARVARALRDVLRVNVKFGAYKHAEEPARTIVGVVVEATILVLTVHEVLAGRLAAPTFFLLLYVGRAAMVQVGLLASAYTQMQAVVASAARVSRLLAEAPEVPDGTEDIASFRDRISLRRVGFAYGSETILEGVAFDIRKGHAVAIVGPSGAGKSTLADLILRFYDPTEGSITIDGRDLRALRQSSYRRLFGVVPQEALLLNGSVRENIAYGREGISEGGILRAARIANAHEFIMELPDGYGTQVGDRGIRLSGGQRQRVAMARAIVANPEILVLDEATSSLDTESEKAVQQAIERLVENSTSIIIAHRLSTILHADQIVVLNNRGVEAVGTHRELLEANPTYARLYQLQFADDS